MRLLSLPISLGFTALFGLAACGGGGGGSSNNGQVDPIVLAAVSALFPINGANWNDYVDATDPDNITDTTCDTVTITDCLHGGEARMVEVTGRSSCDGLIATDALGVFNWQCDASTNPVRMISTGLADNVYLSDLIDFAGTAFLPNSVSVLENGVLADTTSASVWWGNAIAVDNDGGNLSTESAITLVTTDVTAEYIIDADRIGFVIQPGVTLSGDGTGGHVVFGNASRLWLEGRIDAAGNFDGIRIQDAHFSRLRNMDVSNATTEGIYIVSGQRMHLRYMTAVDNRYGIRLNAITANTNATLEDAYVSSNTDCGLFVTGRNNIISRVNAIGNGTLGPESANLCLHGQNADGNRLTDINASDGATYGIWLGEAGTGSASQNMFSNIRVSNNGNNGIQFGMGAAGNSFSRVIVSNNGVNGIQVSWEPFNYIAGITAVNNGGDGIQGVGDSSLMSIVAGNNGNSGVRVGANATALNLVATNNGGDGVYLFNADNSIFSGLLKVGLNGAGPSDDCVLNGGTMPGLDTNCANVGSSDATVSFSVDAATSFVGKITSDDTLNTSDTNGGATDTQGNSPNFDWINFDNDFRAWGRDGSAFANTNHRGRWPDAIQGDGRIWDWSVATSDVGDGGNPALLNVLALPDGNDTFDFVAVPVTQTGLRNAIEFVGDNIGDDDEICESDETCLYTPNIGAYQGHGDLINAGAFTDGMLTGITLLRYKNNGR